MIAQLIDALNHLAPADWVPIPALPGEPAWQFTDSRGTLAQLSMDSHGVLVLRTDEVHGANSLCYVDWHALEDGRPGQPVTLH